MTNLPEPNLQLLRLPEKADYLAPDGSEIRLLPDVSGGGLAHCTLPRRGISKPVVHQTVEEIWYFISGKGQVWRKIGEDERVDDVSSGISLTIPVGTHFQFRNTGEDSLCIVIATIPRWPSPEEAIPVSGLWETRN